MVKRYDDVVSGRIKSRYYSPIGGSVAYEDYDRLAKLAWELAITYLNDSETAEAILKELGEE